MAEASNGQRFLQELSALTHGLSNPDRVMAATARLLGQHLDADRCAYAEMEADDDYFVVHGDYARGVASIVGRGVLSAFGPEAIRLLRNNQTLVVADAENDPRTAAHAANYRAIEVRALVNVPLCKDKKLVACLAVQQKTVRHWTLEEITLVERVADRCWEAIERTRALRSLRESEARNSAVVNSSLDAIISMDHKGRITEWNPAAEQIFGYRRAQALGQPMAHLIIPREQHRLGIDHWLQTGTGRVLGRRIEVQAMRSDGAEFPAEMSISRIANTDPSQYTATLRDITERRQAEQALHDNDRRKDEFLATLAHELRNPLAPITNSLHILRMSPGADAAPLHAMMERQANHLVRLVDDLLEVSRISRGRIELKRQRIELATVVNHALETARPLLEAGAHRLSVHLPREPLLLDADPVRLAQVLANLLNNAAKYTPPHGRISLNVRRADGQAEIAVRDNGAGIPAPMLSRVFDMFAQVNRTLDRSQGGLGIGLSLARTLVQQHGGTIEAHSEGPDRGSEFIVRLPLAAAGEFKNTQPSSDARKAARL